MTHHIVGFVFARGGSKGVPRKNLRLLAGKPLIAHAIDVGRQSRWIERVVVSTEDAEIAAVARQFGADVPFLRPAELATDTAPEWLAWHHAIRAVNAASDRGPIDVFVSIPATAPLRSVQDVDACITALLESDADIVITVTEAQRNPYFNMVVVDDSGRARVVMAGSGVVRRQDAPAVYDMTTVAYAARPEFVLRASSLFEGRVHAVVVPRRRALDIDDELDLRMAELLLSDSAQERGVPRGVGPHSFNRDPTGSAGGSQRRRLAPPPRSPLGRG
jgi:N-acylneuraminate cytidylyltransferase